MSDVDLEYFRRFGGDDPMWNDGRGGRRARGRRRRARKRGRFAFFFALAFLFTVIATGGLVGYAVLRTYMIPPDYDGQGFGQVTVQVQDGDSASAIAGHLERADVVKSARAFEQLAKTDPRSQSIQPGFYQMRVKMSVSAALGLLLDPKSRADTRITIPEGYRTVQTIEVLAKKTGIPRRDFQQALTNPDELGLPEYAKGKVEGYLYPATYDLDPNATATEILQMMVARFNKVAADIDLESLARQADLSPGSVVTGASLAQSEAGRHSDMPKITRVMYNRLRLGWELEFDSTVMFALNKYGIAATNKDLEVNSPYNTYRYKGLPPGAISNPGRDALEAALDPARGQWMYFVTTDPAKKITRFTADPQEFERFKQQLQRNLQRQGG